jgi:hypothetical protein
VLAQRLCASADVFRAGRRPPTASINYVVSHDGFTLRDLVSYERKHNEANGEDNRDGTANNLSINAGVEGPSDDPAVLALRGRLQRALLATLLLAQGVPMLASGDELATASAATTTRTAGQRITWIDWDAADPALIDYTAHVIALRKRRLPLANRWYSGLADARGRHDLTWLRRTRRAADRRRVEQPRVARPRALIGAPGRDAAPLLLLFNGRDADAAFRLPPGTGTPSSTAPRPTAAAPGAAGAPSSALRARKRRAGCATLPRLRGEVPSMRFPRATACCCTRLASGPHGSGRLRADARQLRRLARRRRPEPVADPAAGRHRRRQFALHSTSAFAGNRAADRPRRAAARGWLSDAEPSRRRMRSTAARRQPAMPAVPHARRHAPSRGAFRRPRRCGGTGRFRDVPAKKRTTPGCPSYALFMASQRLTRPRPLGRLAGARRPAATAAALPRRRAEHIATRIAIWEFGQWRFFRQWAALSRTRTRAACASSATRRSSSRYHSAEVWAGRICSSSTPAAADRRRRRAARLLQRDRPALGQPAVPLERACGRRLRVVGRAHRRTFELVDVVRIDHFRGFAAYWEIPAYERTAINGRWVPGPGAELFDAIAQALGPAADHRRGPRRHHARRRRAAQAVLVPRHAHPAFAFDSDAA